MEFVVNKDLNGLGSTDPMMLNRRGLRINSAAATPPAELRLQEVDRVGNYPQNMGGTSALRDMALIEEESQSVCVQIDVLGNITYVPLDIVPLDGVVFDPLDPNNACVLAGGVPFAPKEAVLGYNGSAGAPTSSAPSAEHRGRTHPVDGPHSHQSGPGRHRGMGALELDRGCSPDPPAPGEVQGSGSDEAFEPGLPASLEPPTVCNPGRTAGRTR